MSITTKSVIKRNRERFFGGKLGCTDDGSFEFHLYTYKNDQEESGNYHAWLAISPLSYRREHGTKCAFADEGACLIIFDDWGTPCTIEAPRDVLDSLVAELRQHEFAERTAATGEQP